MGAADGPAPGEAVSAIPDMGGLVARGDGTAAGKPNADVDGPRLKPRLGKFGVDGGGGLDADVAGVEGTGTVPLLNSAQRGHLRFVSAQKQLFRKKKVLIEEL